MSHEETKTELVIDRKRWLRGEGSLNSRLLRPSDGKMCCLGFYGVACGISRDRLLGIASPDARGVAWPSWMRDRDDDDWFLHDDVTALMSINDISGDEAKIAAIFARHGVTVRFVDEPEAP